MPLMLVAMMGSVYLASAESINSSRVEALRPTTALECGPLTKILLAQLGLSPDALAAIGATDDQVSAIINTARALCDSQAADFDGAQATVEQAQTRYNDLSQRVRRGLATQEDRTQLDQARAILDDAITNRQVILSQVQAQIDAVLDSAQQQRLANIIAARDVEVPIHYKLTRRSSDEWVALRDSLSEERRTGRGIGTGNATRPVGDEVAAQDLVINRRADVAARWQQALAAR